MYHGAGQALSGGDLPPTHLPQVFSGGDAAKALKVVLSASTDVQPRCWEVGLMGMRKGGVRYVAVAAAAVAAEDHLGRAEAGPGGARLYRLELLKMKRGGTSKEACSSSSSAPDAIADALVATEAAAVALLPATSPLPTPATIARAAAKPDAASDCTPPLSASAAA